MNDKIKKLEEEYQRSKKERMARAKAEPNKNKRFWKVVWYWVSFPFVWIWYNIRDWRTLVIFIIVFLALSSEVWVPILIGLMLDKNSLVTFGLSAWAFWLLPATPFLPLCITVTIGIKALFNKKDSKK